jgi:hypothetical protein
VLVHHVHKNDYTNVFDVIFYPSHVKNVVLEYPIDRICFTRKIHELPIAVARRRGKDYGDRRFGDGKIKKKK